MGTQQVIPSQPGVDSAVYFPPGTVTLTCSTARSGGHLFGPATQVVMLSWGSGASRRRPGRWRNKGARDGSSAEQYTKSGWRGGVTRTLTSPRNASACAYLGDARPPCHSLEHSPVSTIGLSTAVGVGADWLETTGEAESGIHGALLVRRLNWLVTRTLTYTILAEISTCPFCTRTCRE